MAIVSYKDKGTRGIALGLETKESRKTLPVNLHQSAKRKLAFIAAAESLNDIKSRPGLGLHALRGDRGGLMSIKINDQFRICFEWLDKNALAVEIVDYH